MNHSRSFASSWETEEGLYLIGGVTNWEQFNTSVLIKNDGSVIENVFQLKYLIE